MQKTLKAKDIDTISTINSMYADSKIEIKDKKGEFYRMDVSEITKLLKGKTLIAIKQRKYYHLTIKP